MISQAARQIVVTIGMTMISILDPVTSALPFRAARAARGDHVGMEDVDQQAADRVAVQCLRHGTRVTPSPAAHIVKPANVPGQGAVDSLGGLQEGARIARFPASGI